MTYKVFQSLFQLIRDCQYQSVACKKLATLSERVRNVLLKSHALSGQTRLRIWQTNFMFYIVYFRALTLKIKFSHETQTDYLYAGFHHVFADSFEKYFSGLFGIRTFDFKVVRP